MFNFNKVSENVSVIICKYCRILKYGRNSVIVTIIDVFIVQLLVGYFAMNIVISNTIGVSVGFLLHYWFSIEYVFSVKSCKIGFVIYFATFIMGLALADYTIWLFYEEFKTGFYMSKGASIIIPFFIMYNIRKYLYSNINRNMKITNDNRYSFSNKEKKPTV